MTKRDPITGGYIYLVIDRVEYRVYYEEAGKGIPLILRHTAGSDGRQYRHLLCDQEVTHDFRAIGFDLPYHGKSLPPHGDRWWAKEYNMTKDRMMDFPNALAEALGLPSSGLYGQFHGRPYGRRSGLQLSGKISRNDRGRRRAAIGGRICRRQHGGHPQGIRQSNVHRTSIGAAMMLNMSPYSPEENIREIQWEYSCGGPGIFAGDLHYYYCDHNVSDEEARAIDTTKCMLYLLTGEYDPNTSPEETQALADLVKGTKFWPMGKLGHFPVTENIANFESIC